MFEFSKIIREIDAVLAPRFQPGAFKWADDTMGDAHKNAVDRFENAINMCTPRCDWVSLRLEGDVYRANMLKILHAYKDYKQLGNQESFLKALEEL